MKHSIKHRMKRMPKTTSIRRRIAGGYLLILLLTSTVVLGSFNLLLNSYIRSQAMRQLTAAGVNVNSAVFKHDEWPRLPPRDDPRLSDTMQRISGVARRATFLTQVQAFVISPQYELVFPNNDWMGAQRAPGQPESVPGATPSPTVSAPAPQPESLPAYEDEIRQNLLDLLRQRNLLDQLSARPTRVENGAETYFVSALPLREESAEATLYLLLFLDMTDVVALSRTINMVLLGILLVAGLIALVVQWFVANRITRPVRALSSFAEAMGRNDFTPLKLAVRERELIELRDAMNRAAQQLDTYDKDQKQFFQNVSHELRTPLMSIKGYAEGIKVRVFEDDAQAADVIMTESDHLTDMVEDLLYLSKLNNITSAFEPALCDLRELLSNCGESLLGLAMREGKRVEYDFGGDAVDVMCDEKHLGRALLNVLGNCLRYADAIVTVRCTREGGRARIVVRDDGPGIAPEDAPHLFERFYKGAGGKHGIGLSIAKSVIEQHGGTIEAHTDRGAVFTIELPCPTQEITH